MAEITVEGIKSMVAAIEKASDDFEAAEEALEALIVKFEQEAVLLHSSSSLTAEQRVELVDVLRGFVTRSFQRAIASEKRRQDRLEGMVMSRSSVGGFPNLA